MKNLKTDSARCLLRKKKNVVRNKLGSWDKVGLAGRGFFMFCLKILRWVFFRWRRLMVVCCSRCKLDSATNLLRLGLNEQDEKRS